MPTALLLRAGLYVTCNNVSAIRGVKGNGSQAAAAVVLATQLSNLPTSSPFCR